MHALGAGAHTRTHGVMRGRATRGTSPSTCHLSSHVTYPHMSITLHVAHAAREPAAGVNSLDC
jgi:hypothetical protein